MRFAPCLLVATVAFGALAASAQEPPGRAGRLAFAEGSVSLYMDPEVGWEPAYVNMPITSENSVWTDIDSRAELRVSGMSLRLDETTQLDVSELLDDSVDATLARGALNVRIRHLYGRVAVHTPQARFLLQAAGRYRIDFDPERGDSRLTVFEGRAALEGGSGRLTGVPRGRSIVVWGADRPTYALQSAFTTEFDRWAVTRDEHWVERQAPRYVSTYMTGYEDLDTYGQWTVEPDYGPLWMPTRVSADWVPYRYGHWGWVRPWGWTWIDDQPWGYAPFHYGRWVYVRNRWAWYPGQRVERPVWAPALVAWVGGSNWSVNVRSGSAPVVGWYPLSPFERYQPWYQANAAYVNNINLRFTISDRDRAGRYAERQREITRNQGATVVQREALVARRPVQQAMVQVTPEVVRQQQVAQQPATMLPSRNEFVRASQARRTATAPATGGAPATGTAAAPAAPSAASTARQPGASATARPVAPGAPAAAPVMAPPTQRPSFARQPQAPAPQAAPAGATPPPQAPVARATPPGQERSRFGPGAAPPAPGTPPSAKGQEAQDRRDARETQREQAQPQQQAPQQTQQQQRAQQEQAAREAQQRAQQEQAAREQQQRTQQEQAQRAQQEQAQRGREAQQRAQEREQQRLQQEQAGKEQQQRAQQQQQQQQERAAREAQQRAQEQAAKEQAAKEQQQRAQQQQQQQERAAREAQQRAQEQAAKEQAAKEQQQRAQQQQQQQQQERAAREAQQRAQEQAAKEQQQRAQQQQQQQQERAAREAQQRAQEQAAKERAAKEQAAKEQAAKEQAAKEQQQRAQQQQQQPSPPPPPAQNPAARAPDKGKGKDKEKDKEEEEKGKR